MSSTSASTAQVSVTENEEIWKVRLKTEKIDKMMQGLEKESFFFLNELVWFSEVVFISCNSLPYFLQGVDVEKYVVLELSKKLGCLN